MKHQNINVIENGIKVTLNLGRQGEYNVRDIKFDMSDFQQKYGDGTATIVHYPANGSAYTVPSISGDSKDSAVLDSDNILTWTIGRLATRYDGKGIAEITWITLDGLKKSVIYNTYCKESIGDYGADRAAQQSYIDQMVELASTITDLSSEFSDAERIAAEIVDARENAVSNIETLESNVIGNINNTKSESIEDIGDSKESALNALNTAKQTALSDIESAKQDAETDINAAILIAETHANNASQSATNASNSATSASNSADSASQSATSAQTSATNASNSAASASQYADNASSSANSASQSAALARASATNASTSEQNARQSAETAQDVLDSVQAEGNTQINRVQSEGNTQIGRVQAKGNEILNSLPSDFTQVQNDIAALNGSLGLLESGHKTFTQEDIVQGTYNADGSVKSNANRIRIKGFIELNAGETLSFEPGTNVAGMLYGTFNENKVFQRDSPWYTAEHTITTDKHIYIICVFKNSDGTSISPIDFDAVVTKTLSATNDINNLNEILEISISPTSDEIIENRFISTDGKLSPETDNANATDYLNIRDIVSDNLTITCTVYGYAGFAIYDANMSVLMSVTGNNAASYSITPSQKIQTFIIQKPAGAYYIRLSAWKTSYTEPSDLKVKGKGFSNLNSRLSTVERKIDSVDTGTLSDKKVLVIGDSISTDAYGSYKKWVTDLINAGFFDGEKVTNSSQHATGFVARYNSQPNDFITRLKAIENPSQYDLVVIFGGINDYIQNIPMGEETGTDYTVSFKPAVNEFFSYLIENFTQARLCVLLPLRTYATWKNSVDEYQQAYGDYIKSVAKTYCLPVLNLTEDSGFFPWKTTFRNMWTLIPQGYDGGDGVHPNEDYQNKYLSPMIKHFLKGLI